MAMLLESEDGILSAADGRVLAILMSPNRTMRRLMAADRTMAGAHARVATLRRMRAVQASQEHARAERERAKDETDGGLAPGWGRLFTVRVPAARPEPRRTASVRAAARATTSRRTIRSYKAPLVDDRGRVALYLKISYRGFKSKDWRPGLAAAHIDYIYRDQALEEGDLQLDAPISNMGECVEEIEAGWRVLETVEEGYRANAKVQYRLVWNLPHELTPQQRRALVRDYCERTFGRLGLPYAAAIHEPDAKGDQRNYHAHISFSTRPCERTGDHRWAVSEEKVNGLTDKDGCRLMRGLAAAHMNRAVQAAGLAVRYTHQTYAQRGLDAVRQEHVGPAAMAAHDRGEDVGAVARNARIVEGNEAAEGCRQVARRIALAEREETLLTQALALAMRAGKIAAALEHICVVQKAAAAMGSRLRGAVSRRNPQADLRAIEALWTGAARIADRVTVANARKPINTQPAIGVRQGAKRLVDRIARMASIRPVAGRLTAAATLVVRARATTEGLGIGTPRPAITLPLGFDTKVHGIARRLAKQRRLVPPAVSSLPVATPLERLQRMAEHRARLADLQDRAGVWTERLAGHRAERDRDAEAARALIMDAATPPYRIDGRVIRLDLSALDDAGRALFAGLDTETRTALIKARMERDREEARAATERTRIARDAEATAARERQALVAQACQILETSERRPYRIIDTVVQPDLSVLRDAERALVQAVGFSDPVLVAAFKARVKCDHADDMRAATPAPAVAPCPAEPDGAGWRRARVRRAAAMADEARARTDTDNVVLAGATAVQPGIDLPMPAPSEPHRQWHQGIRDNGLGG